jgi:hypothetical protein
MIQLVGWIVNSILKLLKSQDEGARNVDNIHPFDNGEF